MKNILAALILSISLILAPLTLTAATATTVAPVAQVATKKATAKISINTNTSTKVREKAWAAFDKNVNSGKIDIEKITRTAEMISFVGTSKVRISSKSIISAKSGKVYYIFTATEAARYPKISKAEFKAIAPAFKACKTEDSLVCVWHADKRGNKKGKSFISLNKYTVLYSK